MIDYNIISFALSYYQGKGFKYIEVPWAVDTTIASSTYPMFRNKWKDTKWYGNAGVMIGSGEQGFLDLMWNKKLAPGKYVCVTPCFRDEPVLDELHQDHFMKVELIDTRLFSNDFDHRVKYERMITISAQFFNLIGISTEDIVTGDKTTDIIDRKFGIELGSYGIRSYQVELDQTLNWIYGTGAAEPRTSTVLKKIYAKG